MVIVIIVGFVSFNLPQRIGLVKTPTEKLLSVTPDREAATAIMADLQITGTDIKGFEVYIFSIIGTEENPSDDNVALVIIDTGQGFDFRNFSEQDLMNYMEKLSSVGESGDYNIERVVVAYRDENGESLLTLTAPTETILKFSSGSITREQFLKEMEGQVNFGEVAKKITEMAQ